MRSLLYQGTSDPNRTGAANAPGINPAWNVMSESAPTADTRQDADSTPDGAPLTGLRAEIDAMDDEIHDLLMRRAGIVERVAREGGKSGVMIRPGREASILRRLMRRHDGSLPRATVIRIWRELFAGALMIEGGLTVAVADGKEADMPAIAREHFGPLTPLRRHRSTSQALADLTGRIAQIAVLPIPSDADDEQAAWWVGLMHGGKPRLSIVAKLPFWGLRPDGVPQTPGYAVAALTPDPSGADRGLLGLEISPEMSTARIAGMLKEAGLAVRSLLPRRGVRHAAGYALAEVEGLVAADDPRLARLTGFPAPPVVLGGYALPIDGGGEAA